MASDKDVDRLIDGIRKNKEARRLSIKSMIEDFCMLYVGALIIGMVALGIAFIIKEVENNNKHGADTMLVDNNRTARMVEEMADEKSRTMILNNLIITENRENTHKYYSRYDLIIGAFYRNAGTNEIYKVLDIVFDATDDSNFDRLVLYASCSVGISNNEFVIKTNTKYVGNIKRFRENMDLYNGYIQE